MANLNFSITRRWYFGKLNKQIRLCVAGINQRPSIYLEVDGGDDEVTLHLACIVGIWISFQGFVPDSIYPTYESKPYGKLRCSKSIKFYWYEWAVWWNLWMRDDEWRSTDPKWRRNSIHFDRLLMGKHSVAYEVLEEGNFLLPFFEGTYRVKVIKKMRVDSWQRWFTRKSVCFEVEAGYMENGKWVELPIPHQGKGENSWDCGEDGTYRMYFHSCNMENKERSSLYEGALYFWRSCMRQRERYGSASWIPSSYREKSINLLTAPPKPPRVERSGEANNVAKSS